MSDKYIEQLSAGMSLQDIQRVIGSEAVFGVEWISTPLKRTGSISELSRVGGRVGQTTTSWEIYCRGRLSGEVNKGDALSAERLGRAPFVAETFAITPGHYPEK